MDNNYINFYNNLIHLTRNKMLYREFPKQDTFSDRLVILLFHFAFFLSVFKNNSQKNTLQGVFDYIFKQIEITIREIGYGDTSINKKMKSYVNLFYTILSKIENWNNLTNVTKMQIFSNYLNINEEPLFLTKYFDNYRNYLKKNTFNSLVKGVIKPNF